MGKYTNLMKQYNSVSHGVEKFCADNGIDKKVADSIMKNFTDIETNIKKVGDLYYDKDGNPTKEYDAVLKELVEQAYFDSLGLIIDNIKEKTKVGLVVQEQSDINEKIFQDYSSLMSDVFRACYFKHLTPGEQKKLKSNGYEDYYFKPSEKAYNFIKSKVVKHHDIVEKLKNKDEYNTSKLIELVNDKTNSAKRVNIDNTDDNPVNQDLLSHYIILKENYEKKNIFYKIFAGRKARNAIKNAETHIKEKLMYNSQLSVYEFAKICEKPSDNYFSLVKGASWYENPVNYTEKYKNFMNEIIEITSPVVEVKDKYITKEQYSKEMSDKIKEYAKQIKEGTKIDINSLDKEEKNAYDIACKNHNLNVKTEINNIRLQQLKNIKDTLTNVYNNVLEKERNEITTHGYTENELNQKLKEVDDKYENLKKSVNGYTSRTKAIETLNNFIKEKGLDVVTEGLIDETQIENLKNTLVENKETSKKQIEVLESNNKSNTEVSKVNGNNKVEDKNKKAKK